MPHLYQKLLIYYWFVNVNRIFDWNLDRNLYLSLNLDWRLLNVERLVNIDRLFHNRWDWNLNRLNNLFFHLFYDLHGYFFLDFNILGDLDHLLYNTFRSWNYFRDFHNNFNRFLYNNLFDNFLGNSRFEASNLILPFL